MYQKKNPSSNDLFIKIQRGLERLPALHYSVDFIFLSFGILGFIVELWNY